jgi:hypothetical protein
VSPSWAEVARQVVARAGDRCEYCRMHQSLQGATFHIEHIVPCSEDGSDDLANLCLACPSCNLHKSNRVTVSDPDTGQAVPLFNPRALVWGDHSVWNGTRVIGITAAGRATVAALDLNAPRRLLIREAEALFQLFPPGRAEPA